MEGRKCRQGNGRREERGKQEGKVKYMGSREGIKRRNKG